MISFKIRNLITNLLAWIFKVVKIPDSLIQIKPDLSKTILIAQTNSIVIESLILSLARQAGFEDTKRISRVEIEDIRKNESVTLHPLCWTSIHDLPQKDVENLNVNANCNIHFRTINVFQVTGPIRKWPSFRPSIFWIWGLIPTRRILKITLGEPISLIQSSNQRLIRLIKIDFIRTLKLVRGSPIEPIEEQALSVLSGNEFEREIKILSERNNISYPEGYKLAKDAFYELAANPKRFMYDILGLIAKLILNRLFSEMHIRGLEVLRPAIKEQTVVLVPMHRSHLDYILVAHKLISEKVTTPFVAAGINLSFWPFGFIFRSVGAYFVKRNAKDRFHAIVLKRYVSYLVNHGHLQEFFIEGGRSRSGKMLEPKLGLLSTIIEAAKNITRRDVLFVPVGITYENIVEDEDYGKENSGRSKVKESITSTFKAFDIFKRRYGEVILEFGSPISLKDFSNTTTNTSNKSLAQSLGFEICRSIREQINLSLTSLAYSSILMTANYGLKSKELRTQIIKLDKILKLQKSCGLKIGSYTSQLENFLKYEDHGMADLSSAKVLNMEQHQGSQYFFIPGNRRFTADYYRNSIIHYFFPIALIALAEMTFKRINEEAIKNIFKFFEHDLLLNPWEEFSIVINKLCKSLAQQGILTSKEDREFKFNDYSYYLPQMLASHIESYFWVSKALLSNFNYKLVQAENLVLNKFVSSLIESAKSERHAGGINRTEATSKSSIMSSLNSMESRGLIKFSEGTGSNRKISISSEGYTTIREDCTLLKTMTYEMNKLLLEEEFKLNSN